MKKFSTFCMAVLVSVGIVNAAYIDPVHGFDAPSLLGTNFIIEIDGWQSTNLDVVVTDSKSVSPSHSVILPAGTSISNKISETPATKAWTEFSIIPMLGAKPYSSIAASNSTFSLYFNADGKVEVWTDTDWTTCSSNVWGTALGALDGTNWVDVSIYQNFSTHKAVIFLNGKVALQDVPFSDETENNYNLFVVDNVDSNAFIDDVLVHVAYDTTRLTENNNGINGVDAKEVDEHGYVGRQLDVGNGSVADLSFATLQDAVNEARNLDRIYIHSTNMSEDITFQNDDAENNTYYLIGDAFTNAGTFTVASGATLHIEQFANISTNIVTGSLSLSNNLVAADLQVTGTVSGNDIAATNVNVGATATVTIASGGTFDIDTLVMANGGSIDVTSGTLDENNDTVLLTGTFVLDGDDWNASGVATASLDFSETFDDFVDNTKLNSKTANLIGWGANIDGVKAQSAIKHGASGLAAIIPATGILSNRISTSEQKIWTEYYIMPALGSAPIDPDTNSAVFYSYVTTNGYMAVPTNGGWKVFSQDMGDTPTAYLAMSTTTWTRVDIFTDFTSATNKYALFIDGRIAAEQRSFVGALGQTTYHNFSIISDENVAYLDDVLITADIPPNMTEDVNNNGVPDAFNIHNYGTIYPPANGSLFKFK